VELHNKNGRSSQAYLAGWLAGWLAAMAGWLAGWLAGCLLDQLDREASFALLLHCLTNIFFLFTGLRRLPPTPQDIYV